MAIAYASASAGGTRFTVTSGQDLAPTAPGVVDAGDILIAHVAYRTDTTNSPDTPAEWTLLYGPITVTTATAEGRHWIYGKVADGDEDGAAVNFGSETGTYLRLATILRYTGRVSGTIADCVPTASFSDVDDETDPAGPTVTTTVTGALAVGMYFQTDDNTAVTITDMTGGTWSAVRTGLTSSLGDDGAFSHFDCTPTDDPGTVTGGAGSTANDQVNTIGFEIRPNAPSVSHTDSPSGTVTLSGTRTESYSAPVVYNDSRSGTMVTSGTRTESNSRVSSPSGNILLSGSVEESWSVAVIYDDSASGSVVLSGSVSNESHTTNVLARVFDGSAEDDLHTAIGACNVREAATLVVLVRRVTDGVREQMLGVHTAAGVLTTFLSTGVAPDENHFLGLGAHSPSIAPMVDDGWCICAVSKATGLTYPRFHIKRPGNPSWEHEEGKEQTGTPRPDQAGGSVRFNCISEFGFADLEIAVAGIWNVELTDEQVEEFSTNRSTQDWYAHATATPVGLWQFNQATPATDLVDLTGNGADQTSISGTTVIDDGPGDWDYITVYNDSCSGTITLGGSASDEITYDDAQPGTVVLSGAAQDGLSFSNSQSGTVTLTGAITDSHEITATTAGTILLSGSVSESYSVASEYSDSPTGVLLLSGTTEDSQTRTSTVTGTILLSGSVDDSLSFADATTGTVLLTGMVSESYVVANTYNDAPTGSILLSGSITRSTVFEDTAAGTLILAGTAEDSSSFADTTSGVIILSGSVEETHALTDSQSGTITVSGSAEEAQVRTSQASGVVVLSGSASDDYVGATIYNDSATGTLVLSGSVSRSTVYLDVVGLLLPGGFPGGDPPGATALIVLSGSAQDTYTPAGEYNDSATGTILLSGSVETSESRTSLASGTILLSGSAEETHSTTDQQSGTILLSGTATESLSFADSQSGTVILSGSVSESWSHAGEFSDSPTGQVTLSGSVVESFAPTFTDSPSGVLSLSGTAQDSQSRVSSQSGQVTLSGSVVESWAKGWVDLPSGTIILSGSATDELRRVSTPTGTIYLSGSVTDSTEYVTALAGQITLSGTASEFFIPSGVTYDYPTGTIRLSGSLVEYHGRWDWIDGERWPHDSDSRWGPDTDDRWEVDALV